MGDFWERVPAWPGTVVVWMSSNAVHELCGLHVMLWRLPDVRFHLVDIASSRGIWEQLRTENAPLRILTDAGLVSQPVTYFDDQIRALITDDWQRCARVVGGVMDTLSETLDQFRSDIFLFVRMLRLLDEDDLEGRNDDGPEALWSMHTSWVRRRPSAVR